MPERDDVDAVVLVGGQGTRLRPLTLSAPKPMLPTAGVPFLEHMLSRIRAAGITHVVLGTSYKAETFTEYFGDGSAFGLDIEYVVEDVPRGTGGGIRNVADRLRADTVMVFNGDVRVRSRPDGAAGDARRQRRRRHPAPGQGRRSARLRVGAHRGRRPGGGVPGEDRQPADRPDQRRLLRLQAQRDPGHPGRAGWCRWNARPSRGCWPRERGCSGTSTPPTGSISAPRRRSSAVPPTW